MRNAEFFTRVQTGHSAGRITISLREADTVKREKTRVQFDEPQRTLVGHFRHELGHYIWDRLVSGRDENRFRQLIAYEAAMARHHSQGPIGNWQLAAGVHFGLCDDAPVGRFCGNGRCLFVANEWDRDMGLLDLVPEIFSPKVVEKMKYVDSLRKR